MSAVVAAWLPGTEGGGLSDVLFGMHAPSGKLAPAPLSRALPGNLLTGAGTEFERLTIRIRVDTSSLDVPDSKGKRRLGEPEPEPAAKPKRKSLTGK